MEETSIPIDRYAGLRRFPGGFDQLHARFRRCCIVLNPSVGIRVESERLWDKANDNRIGRVFFASKMDHEQDNVVERIDSMLEGLEVKGFTCKCPSVSRRTSKAWWICFL